MLLLIVAYQMRIGAWNDDPGYAEIFFEAGEIGWLKILPVALGGDFVEPAGGEARNARSHAAIFVIVGEHAALGESAEAVVVLTGELGVVGIDCEQAVDGSVLTDPCEGLQPWILRREAWEFQVRGMPGTGGFERNTCLR